MPRGLDPAGIEAKKNPADLAIRGAELIGQ